MIVSEHNDIFRRILVCGDRDWDDISLINSVMRIVIKDPKWTTVIHGGCRGADTIAGNFAEKLGCVIIKVLPDWSMGRRAGPMRNLRMLSYAPDFVIGFHANIEKSKGTKNMLSQSKKARVLTYLITGKKDLYSFPTILSTDLDRISRNR